MALTLYQFNGSNVPPKADARAWFETVKRKSGFIKTPAITSPSGVQLYIPASFGEIMGRWFKLDTTTITATAPQATTTGSLYLKIDTAAPDEPLKLVTYTGEHTAAQEDINDSGTIYELLLATYTISPTTITGLTVVKNDINSPDEIVLEVGSWTGAGPYSITVQYDRRQRGDVPHVGINTQAWKALASADDRAAVDEAYALISNAQSETDGHVTFYAAEEPTADIPIYIKL